MSDEDEDAWDRVLFHLENQTGFWLGLVASDDARPRAELREKARAFWEGEGGVFVLHEPEPGKARSLAVALTRQYEPALHWIRVDADVSEEGAAELVLAMNERREAYRSRLDGGVVIEGRASLKRMVRELAPDLFSIRAFVVEPQAVLAIEPSERPEWRLPLRTEHEGAALSDPDQELDRASRLAGIDGCGAMIARFEALTRAVAALTAEERFSEALLWTKELDVLAEQWNTDDSPQMELRRNLCLARSLQVRGTLRFYCERKGEEELGEAIVLFYSCESYMGLIACYLQRALFRGSCNDRIGALEDIDAATTVSEANELIRGWLLVFRVRGDLEMFCGNWVDARRWYVKALILCRNHEELALDFDELLIRFANVCVMQGDKGAAEQMAAEALQRADGRNFLMKEAMAVLDKIRKPS